ncbi:hypothetical protein GS399_09660 [Pedobacter sp. HMF7647]|uniref:Quinol oxidase subunit 4 n=1 Tax=Hufsiella arboris TaxID=2695275 RepID=A0A7K1Y9H3_9SPHI|nr:hypothetical protein [Hufsiella arboris]MXV51234.1 hypothetical protein [Hufsiella arboris]
MKAKLFIIVALIASAAACKTAVKSVDPGGRHNIPKGTRNEDKDTSAIKSKNDTLQKH